MAFMAVISFKQNMNGLSVASHRDIIQLWSIKLSPWYIERLFAATWQFYWVCHIHKTIMCSVVFILDALLLECASQEAMSILNEYNDAAIAMVNANKPTPRTRHMDIRYFALTEWVEQDLISLEYIDTTMNMADYWSLHQATCSWTSSSDMFHQNTLFLSKASHWKRAHDTIPCFKRKHSFYLFHWH